MRTVFHKGPGLFGGRERRGYLAVQVGCPLSVPRLSIKDRGIFLLGDTKRKKFRRLSSNYQVAASSH